MSEQTPLFEQEQPNGIAIGAPVRWTETRYYSTTFSMTVRDGVLVAINGDLATVRLKSKKTRLVPLADLHTPDQPTVLDSYFKQRIATRRTLDAPAPYTTEAER